MLSICSHYLSHFRFARFFDLFRFFDFSRLLTKKKGRSHTARPYTMGQKKKKLAKGRLDKFYYLAKEQGYRSRAAFKLIQLNKKYNFLGSAKACLDLCAAPGGWMQVASKYMPVQSVIVGVDLDPIRPIRNCVGLQEDITTAKCRTEIKKALKTWKVDICLHDGAPNMGTSWIQDAYQQAELTLYALKLATEFLTAGGWFITKVFRGPDYNSLLWVFHQLFKKVDSTKPQASRNASAEIFVVCQGFLNPKRIDPKLLDPKYVFKEIKEAPKKVNVLADQKQKRHRLGYDDDATDLKKTATVSEFIENNDHLVMLASNNAILFDVESKLFKDHPSTTNEIIECLTDLKVLGKHDFKKLINWKKEMIAYKESLEPKTEEPAAEAPVDDTNRLLTQEELDENLDKLIEETMSTMDKKKRKEKKRANEKKRALQRRIELDMVQVGDTIEQQDDEEVFALKKIKDHQFSIPVVGDHEIEDSDEEVEEFEGTEEDGFDNDEYMEQQLEAEYAQYLLQAKGRLEGQSVNKVSKDKLIDVSERNDQEMEDDIEMDSDDEMEEKLKDHQNPLQIGRAKPSAEKQTSMWFEQDLFKGVGDDADDEEEELGVVDMRSKKKQRMDPNYVKPVHEQPPKSDNGKKKSKYQSAPTGKLNESDNEDDEKADNPDAFEEVPMEEDVEYSSSDSEPEDSKIRTLAMGTLMLRKKTKQDLIDDAYNRYAFNDTDLPSWFVDDEERHNKPQTPITKEQVIEIKKQIREIDSRPIKKIAEAKARKKYRLGKKLDKAKDKANSVVDNEEMSNREKTRAIEKIYESTNNTARKKKMTIITKKFKTGAGGGKKYKVVDKRMKKELRAERSKEKKTGRTKDGGKVQRKPRPPKK
eukprot:gene11486-13394_t